MDAAIFDAAGNLVCAQVMGGCTLTGTGPYQVLASASGQAGSYEFQVAGYLTVYAAGRSRPLAETADFTPARPTTGLLFGGRRDVPSGERAAGDG